MKKQHIVNNFNLIKDINIINVVIIKIPIKIREHKNVIRIKMSNEIKKYFNVILLSFLIHRYNVQTIH